MPAVFIYSTLPNSQYYITYHPQDGVNQVIREKERVLVKGGSGIANKHFVTPLGVVTQVTEAEYEILKEHRLFKLHEKNGYIQVRKTKVDAEVAAADMETRDGSSPIVPEDFKENDLVQPSELTTEEKKEIKSTKSRK